MAKIITFIDTEVGIEDRKIHDIGAVCSDGATFHSVSIQDFSAFIKGSDYICGHNIVHHDLVYLNSSLHGTITNPIIDTLYLSPLLFPKRPYHALLKDDKQLTEELNNPLNDSKKAAKLFYDEVNAFNALPRHLEWPGQHPDSRYAHFYHLLSQQQEFRGFFDYLDYHLSIFHASALNLIRTNFVGKLCSNADFASLIKNYPVELA